MTIMRKSTIIMVFAGALYDMTDANFSMLMLTMTTLG